MKTYTQITFQVVFGSYNHQPFLTSDNQNRLFSYFGGILRKMDCHPIIQGGFKEHIHLVFSLSKNYPLSKVVQEVKKNTNRFMKENRQEYPDFIGWQDGYGGFTYSRDSRDNLVKYVLNQESHHQNETFKEEYISLLVEHGIEFDLKYLF